jgi:hypothetical protein
MRKACGHGFLAADALYQCKLCMGTRIQALEAALRDMIRAWENARDNHSAEKALATYDRARALLEEGK